MLVEHGVGLGELVELAEQVELEVHVLEHRLDDEIGIGDGGDVGRAGEQGHALVDVVIGHPAARGADAVVLLDRRETLLERIGRGFDQRDRNADIGKAHGNAAAHGAGAEHRHAPHLVRLGAGGNVGDFRSVALGEEDVAQRFRVGRVDELEERVALELQALVDR